MFIIIQELGGCGVELRHVGQSYDGSNRGVTHTEPTRSPSTTFHNPLGLPLEDPDVRIHV